ncbi:uncharacterized protein LOC126456277 [Schistocerca serialis cubense]|uniref:uncharacterized protein LOC126456277 n=1 Tax=Schistocerca serialis cubense TaxID=2023355 RepID=UPI00214F112B|nr:uncharacterized protein LOC126456277 [Schistocerca serialis cubense]
MNHCQQLQQLQSAETYDSVYYDLMLNEGTEPLPATPHQVSFVYVIVQPQQQPEPESSKILMFTDTHNSTAGGSKVSSTYALASAVKHVLRPAAASCLPVVQRAVQPARLPAASAGGGASPGQPVQLRAASCSRPQLPSPGPPPLAPLTGPEIKQTPRQASGVRGEGAGRGGGGEGWALPKPQPGRAAPSGNAAASSMPRRELAGRASAQQQPAAVRARRSGRQAVAVAAAVALVAPAAAMNTEALIAAVYRRSPLWDTGSIHNRDRRIVDALWKEVAAELNCADCTAVKKRWKSLKDYYRCELAKVSHTGGEGSTTEATSNWPFFHLMSFTKRTIGSKYRPRSLEQQLFCEDSKQATVDSSQYDADEETLKSEAKRRHIKTEFPALPHFPDLSESTSFSDTIAHAPVSFMLPPHKRSSRRRHHLDSDACADASAETKALSLTEREIQDVDSDELLFFKSLLPYMRNMNYSRKLLLRMKILELVYNEYASS